MALKDLLETYDHKLVFQVVAAHTFQQKTDQWDKRNSKGVALLCQWKREELKKTFSVGVFLNHQKIKNKK